MKKSKRLISATIAALTAAGMLAGCSKEPEQVQKAELTYWTQLDPSSSQTLSSYNDMMFYQEMAKRTGIEVKFIHPVTGSTGQEAFTTLLASNDMPDMIEYNWSTYPGGADAAIDDGVILKLNDYLEKYAPNYYDYVEGEKNKENNNQYKAGTLTDSGNYYGFKALNIGNIRGFTGIFVRGDILRKWGMEIPETVSDWEKLFEKAKSEGYTKPFTGHANLFTFMKSSNIFNTAFDVGKAFYVEGDKIVHCLTQPGYKNYIALLADWTEKGYIDRNYVTNQVTDMEGNMTNDKISIACYGTIGSVMGKMLQAMKDRDPGYDLVACPYPVINKGDVCEWQDMPSETAPLDIAITADCDDIESAMKWCDYHYTEEGNVLKTFGIEGDTYTIEEIDGEKHYVYTDKILKPETVGATSINGSLYKFLRPANSPGLNQHPDYLNGYYEFQSQKDALITWNQNVEGVREHALPPLTFTADESARIATLNQQYLANTDTKICEIIAGNSSIDTYDEIVEEARKAFIDEIVEIYNAAYKRYLNKLEN